LPCHLKVSSKSSLMKLLHSSDIHLQLACGPRWDALDQLIATAEQAQVDALTIAGDLFDSAADAIALVEPIRRRFQCVPFDVLILPGNHDVDGLRLPLDLGPRVRVLRHERWTDNVVEYDYVRVVGLPFDNLSRKEMEERLHSLTSRLTPDKCNILLYHGELEEVRFDPEETSPHGLQHMPSDLGLFAALNVDLVLAGHYHDRYIELPLGPGRSFIYPGSPVSVRKRERGARCAVLLSPGERPVRLHLQTFHYPLHTAGSMYDLVHEVLPERAAVRMR